MFEILIIAYGLLTIECILITLSILERAKRKHEETKKILGKTEKELAFYEMDGK